MPFGLGSKHTKEEKTDSKQKNSASNAQANEAAELLKKMEDKKAAGDCPFC